MNKLLVVNDKFSFLEQEGIISISEGKILFVKDAEVEFEFNNTESSIDITLKAGVSVKLFITGNKIKNKIVYHLEENSHLTVKKLVFDNNDSIEVFLDGDNSSVLYCYSEISKTSSHYQVSVIHNNENTKSCLYNHGISLDHAAIQFEVNAHVMQSAQKSICNQENQILNFMDSASTILPKLYVDHYDVDATHSAYVGDFKEEDLFYLMSRGIPLVEARKLLIKSFLLGKMELEDKLLSKYIELIENY